MIGRIIKVELNRNRTILLVLKKLYKVAIEQVLKCRGELYFRPPSLGEHKVRPYGKNIHLIAN